MHELSPKYPRARAYLAALPGGFDAFPKCRARGEVYDDVRLRFPDLGRDPSLPEPVIDFFRGRFEKDWMPEVLGQVVHLMIRDQALSTDEAILKWSHETNARFFRDSPFRLLVRLLSPTLLVMGAAQRWTALHEGSELRTTRVTQTDGISRTSGVLTFPDGLFPELFLRVLVPAFQVAVEAARAKDVSVRLAASSSTGATYEIQWR
jgi:hypothetical protein